MAGDDFAEGIAARIAAEFPAWTPEHGACLRCHETYEALAKNYGYLTAGV